MARLGPGGVVAVIAASALFWIAYDNGSYGLESRNALAIVIWWAFIIVVVFGFLPAQLMQRTTLLVGGLIAGLAVWTFASLLWTADAESTFGEFNRVSLYLGTFALVALVARRSSLGRWADALAISIAAVAGVALTSRLFPGTFPERDLPTFLPGTVTRLSFPLGYWNGLAIFVALGIPLFLRLSLVARSTAVRGLAVAPMPLIASAVYLTSSRGGVACALVGSVVFLVLTDRRWTALAALGVSLAGSAAAITVLHDHNELVNGPLGSDLVERQGRSAALFLALIGVATGAVYALGVHLFEERVRMPATVGRVVVVAAIAAIAFGVVASDPVERFERFKLLPSEAAAISRGDFVSAHLLSGGGSGRWQFWSAAIDEWREGLLLGEGAGSFASWWAQHASFTYFVRDAHSLYLETLGELGVIGFLLTVALVVAGIAAGAQRSWRASGEARVTTAALTAMFTAYGLALGLDWMWELTAVSVLGFTTLALVAGPSTAPVTHPRVVSSPTQHGISRLRFGMGTAMLVVAWGLICAQAIPLLASREIARSQDAVAERDLREAADAAEAARDIQPWAATPYLQLALVSERAGDLSQARAWINEAMARDGRNWRFWLVSARLETKLGDPDAAESSLRRAVELNPRSPLFEGLLDELGGS